MLREDLKKQWEEKKQSCFIFLDSEIQFTFIMAWHIFSSPFFSLFMPNADLDFVINWIVSPQIPMLKS